MRLVLLTLRLKDLAARNLFWGLRCIEVLLVGDYRPTGPISKQIEPYGWCFLRVWTAGAYETPFTPSTEGTVPTIA